TEVVTSCVGVGFNVGLVVLFCAVTTQGTVASAGAGHVRVAAPAGGEDTTPALPATNVATSTNRAKNRNRRSIIEPPTAAASGDGDTDGRDGRSARAGRESRVANDRVRDGDVAARL